MSANTWPNLVAMFFDRAERHGDAPFLWAKRDGIFHPVTWRQAAEQVIALARGLKNLGLEAGERVVLVSENRPEWLIADIAIMAAGGVTVPAYTTNTGDDHLHVAENSGAKGAIVSTSKLAKNFLPAAHRADDMDFVITMEAPDISQHLSVNLHLWGDVLADGAAGTFDVAADAGRWRRGDTACIIYTSGTGGAPKGVMLHHGAILHNCWGAADALRELELGDEVFLSFLPLSHSYEHTAGQFFPLSIGAQIYYAEGIETLGADMAQAKPTIMTAVPRLYEMLHARITRGLKSKGGLSQKLFDKALDLGTRRYHDPGALGLGERAMNTVLDALVRSKVRGRFGGRLKALVSGGAPLNPDIGIFFTALGLRILQGYGQTEAAPVISVNRPVKAKMHTVGPPMLDVSVRIAEDGEILVQGDLVMQGYWRNEDATREVIRDGWLHTGDVGLMDEDGYIVITDRKKDIIVNSGGDNLSPQRVEGILSLEPEIAQAMVHGDRRPHLVGLLVPDGEWMEKWAADHARPADLAVLANDDDFQKDLGAAVSRVNEGLSNIERVRRFLVAPDPFTIENGQMTPTMKVRRHVLREIYGEALEALYG
ncbi:MAG: AMP-dependent synthetase/ligase [Rhodospirillales bacterium]|jgi:long-chain acyl-CoA synthetase|nr:AMP-dependent synthetase/ligase [Rhodospirillales bacterium]MDP6883580.1 AMP-dependent synthetase/ligase [Rhodospirillales bacterium]